MENSHGEPDRDWQQDRVGAARAGRHPLAVGRMQTGWAVLGDTQHLPGYCVLLFDGRADQLTELPRRVRAAFLLDLALLGEAVQQVCAAHDAEFSRINYEVLGNSWPHLHGHVHARYRWEPAEFRAGPVWRYPAAERGAGRHRAGAHHDPLRAELTAALASVQRQPDSA